MRTVILATLLQYWASKTYQENLEFLRIEWFLGYQYAFIYFDP